MDDFLIKIVNALAEVLDLFPEIGII